MDDIPARTLRDQLVELTERRLNAKSALSSQVHTLDSAAGHALAIARQALLELDKADAVNGRLARRVDELTLLHAETKDTLTATSSRLIDTSNRLTKLLEAQATFKEKAGYSDRDDIASVFGFVIGDVFAARHVREITGMSNRQLMDATELPGINGATETATNEGKDANHD